MNLAKKELAASLGASWVDVADAHEVEADLFMPCGLGGVLTPQVIAELGVKGVVGAANNQLANHDGAAELAARGIL